MYFLHGQTVDSIIFFPSSKPITAMLTGDDTAFVYVDGDLIKPLNEGKWNVAKKYILPGNFQVFAVAFTNNQGPTGFKGKFSDGTLTIPRKKGGWKCIQRTPKENWKDVSFDDSTWSWAHAHKGVNIKGIDSKAYWIHAKDKFAKKTFCRRVFRRGLQHLVLRSNNIKILVE